VTHYSTIQSCNNWYTSRHDPLVPLHRRDHCHETLAGHRRLAAFAGCGGGGGATLEDRCSDEYRSDESQPRRYLSPDRVVVPRGVFLGPAFRVWLVFAPRAFAAACFPRARRPGPPFRLFRPAVAVFRGRRFGSVPVTLRLLPRSPPCFFAILTLLGFRRYGLCAAVGGLA
jgi:hypothetical protein